MLAPTSRFDASSLQHVPGYTAAAANALNDTELLYANPAWSPLLILREGEMDQFWLDDAQWSAIAPLLPSRQTGPKRSDDRVVISGIVHVLLSGIAWRDCPAEYGPYMTVFNRFNRWKQRGLWDHIAESLTGAERLTPGQNDKLIAAMSTRANITSHRAVPRRQPDLSSRAWDDAADELRAIARDHHGKPIAAWIEVVIEWHMDALFAQAERLLATPQQNGLDQVSADIEDLRSKLLDAVTSLRSYVDDPAHHAAVKLQLSKIRHELERSRFASRRKTS